jgi:hypothetical protein
MKSESKMKLEITARRTFFANIAITLMSVLLNTSPSVLAGEGEDNRAPEVPAEIAVREGNKVHFHGFGRGFQIYTWNGASWGPAVPDATLFDNEGNIVATHFIGPTWRSNSGSSVVGAVIPPRITVDPTAIPWLLLAAVKTEGPGIFAGTTFVQRVNTVGGLAPSTPGAFVGQVASIPYTADYFFYRSANK